MAQCAACGAPIRMSTGRTNVGKQIGKEHWYHENDAATYHPAVPDIFRDRRG